jgi:hypothetical protein
MLNKSILFLILLCFLACEKSIDISKLTAIDGIQLGGKKSLFYNQCDSLNIKKSSFFTKDNFYNNENLDDYLLGTYYTEIFDFSQYRIGEMQHIGLINPFGLTATENIYGVRIFLGHTCEGLYFDESGIRELSSINKSFNQVMTSPHLNNIQNLLIQKYGSPTYRTTSEFNTFYVYEGKNLNEYKCDNNNLGEKLEWETEYLSICLFKGIRSANYAYDEIGNAYISYRDNDNLRVLNYSKGERSTKSFPYIEYKLNSKAIELLNLNNPKI